jgi:hypothetical protein
MEILMKAITFPTRINMFVTSVLDALVQEEKSSTKLAAGKEPPKGRLSRAQRKEFFYYMQLIDDDTKEIVGHLADISSGGFKLDSQNPIPVNKDFRFLMKLTSEVADKPFIVFMARSRWCRSDPIDPYIYDVGYQLVNIASEDLEIFNRMMERYGRDYDKRNIDLRRSNKW